MWRILFLFSLLPIAIAAAGRWYFGLRVLHSDGGRPCRWDTERWLPDGSATAPAGESAHELGRLLREEALREWRQTDPKAVGSRQGARRFGMAVPPLSAMVAIFALIVAKIPALGAVTIVLASTAVACAVGLLSLPQELAAIARAARKLRESRAFARRDDEEAVIRCAAAHAWAGTLPPVIALLQR